MSEARDAKVAADFQLESVQQNWPTIRAIVAPLKVQRQDNHFADRLREIFREGVDPS